MEPIFIDTGGIDLLMDTRDPRVAKYWKRFPKGTKHFICHIAYWEYLRQFDKNENSLARERFVRAVERERFHFLPFDVQEADLAVPLYHGVKELLKELLPDDKKRRCRLTAMQCDIMIAATAVVNNKKLVLTEDTEDWELIRSAVERSRLGTLTVGNRNYIIGE